MSSGYFGSRNKIFTSHIRWPTDFMDGSSRRGLSDFVKALKVYSRGRVQCLLMPDHVRRCLPKVPDPELQSCVSRFGYIRGLIQAVEAHRLGVELRQQRLCRG